MTREPVLAEEPVLEVRGLSKSFTVLRRRGILPRLCRIHAVRDVDLRLGSGECLGLVGESGSGKTTLALCLNRLLEPDAGSIRFRGRELTGLSGAELRRTRRRVQTVFQDPGGALDPRRRVGDSLLRAVDPGGDRAAAEHKVAELLGSVGLAASLAQRYPHELSGGQRQRVTIARALAAEPDVLILDEPVSSLDASVRARILDLLHDLRRERSLSLLFIGHDLGVIERFADRVCVLYLGRVVEEGDVDRVFRRPLHPYTRALVAAVPPSRPSPSYLDGAVLEGEVPSPENPPGGCVFHPRCPRATEPCGIEAPALERIDGRSFACRHPLSGEGSSIAGTAERSTAESSRELDT